MSIFGSLVMPWTHSQKGSSPKTIKESQNNSGQFLTENKIPLFEL